jgi:general secretion pathway protein G
MQSARQGFTLIEIMVVITIIGILASLLFFSGTDARQGAALTKEAATLEQLNLAMKLYRETTGHYPPGQDNCSACSLRAGNYGDAQTQWQLVASALAPDYIGSSISVDAWGNPYAYDNNYRFADSDLYTILCSMGPDGVLQTFLLPNLSDYELDQPDPPVQGDDLCLFIL